MSGFPSRSAPADPAIAIGQAVPLIGTPSSGAFLPVDSVVPRASYPELAARFRASESYVNSISISVSGDRAGIATDGEVIVMVPYSASNQAIVSSDAGASWGNVTLPFSSSGWRGLMYGAGVFCVAQYGTTAGASSGNGTAWTTITLPSAANWNTGAFGGGVFVVLANGGSACARSTNGTTWTSGTLPVAGNWNVVFWDEARSRFFAHTTAATFSAAYSSDGTTWTAATACGVTGICGGFALPSGRYVAVGGTSSYATSDDGGASWTARTLPVSRAASWRVVQSLDGGRAIAQDGSATLLSTEDGESWTASFLPYTTANWSVMAPVRGKPYALLTGRASMNPILRVYPARSGSDIVLRGPAGYHVRVR